MLSKASADESRVSTAKNITTFLGRDLLQSGVAYEVTADDEAAVVKARTRLDKEKTKTSDRFRGKWGLILLAIVIFIGYPFVYLKYASFSEKLPSPLSLNIGFLLCIIFIFALIRIQTKILIKKAPATPRLNWRVAGVDNDVLWILRDGELIAFASTKAFYAIRETNDHIFAFIDVQRAHSFQRAVLVRSDRGKEIQDWLARAATRS